MRFVALAGVLTAVLVAAVAAPPGSRPDRTHLVEIREFRYIPDTLTVAEGDTIRWINRDPVPHTATAADSSWDSGRLEPSQVWSMVVRRANAGTYLCTYHPTMTGALRFKPSGRVKSDS